MLKRILYRTIVQIIRKIFLFIYRRKRLALIILIAICVLGIFNWLFTRNIYLISSHVNQISHHYSIRLYSNSIDNLFFLNDKFYSSTSDALANVWLFSAIPDYRASTNITFTYRFLASHNTSLLDQVISSGTSNLYCHFWLVSTSDPHLSYQVILSPAVFYRWRESGKM